jgi:hypothetical protein
MVSQENTPDTQFDDCLDTWGISLVVEWDLLVFLRRHRTSLVTDERISWLLGYGKNVVDKAVEEMETAGLVRRSRSSQGARIHQLATSVDIPRQESFELLLKLIEKPVARGLLVRRLGLARARRSLRRGQMYLVRKEMAAIIG